MLISCAAATIFLLIVWIARRNAPVVQPSIPVEQANPLPSKRELVGVQSCSASACHGGAETGARLSESATWRALDPHARAYTTLLSDESQSIADHLWRGKTQAHEAPLCLKCHVHTAYENARPNFRREDGVGCESCHGAAQQWLPAHYRADWKRSLGMFDTKSLVGRANVCAPCHVGTPAANVDHDLIAAGHPALRFEFATYFANLPPHWDAAKDKRANSTKPDEAHDFEMKAWAIGQLVSSATAFELTAHRADPANGNGWPEFAELDCFACHHDLRDKNREQPIKRKPGTLAMSDWYHHMLPLVEMRKEARDDFRTHLKDRSKLAARASEEASELRRAVLALNAPFGEGVSLKFIERGMAPPMTLRGETWDAITQEYLAYSALQRTMGGEAGLKRMREEIQFPRGYSSPKRGN